MKKFLLIGLPLQAFVCLLIIACWFQWPMANAAENILNFWGILCLVVSALALFTQGSKYQEKANDPEYELPPNYRYYFVNLINFLQIVALVAMGWYWVASGIALSRVVFNIERDTIIKLRKERASNEQTS